jgi:hypothetical protein
MGKKLSLIQKIGLLLLCLVVYSIFQTIGLWYFGFYSPTDTYDDYVIDYGEYGFRCDDGTEFTMRPILDLESVLIITATSVEGSPEPFCPVYRMSQVFVTKVKG